MPQRNWRVVELEFDDVIYEFDIIEIIIDSIYIIFSIMIFFITLPYRVLLF